MLRNIPVRSKGSSIWTSSYESNIFFKIFLFFKVKEVANLLIFKNHF